jgi:hypothetical protein
VRAYLALALAVGIWLTSHAGPAWGQTPSATLVVVAGDPGAEAPAARVFRTARENMRRARPFTYKDADLVLGRPEDSSAPSRAKELYRKGREAYDNLELELAVKLLRMAARDLDARMDEVMDHDLLTDVYIYWGSALVLSGNKKQGEKIYRRLLVLHPDAQLDSMVFPPSLAATFNRIANEVQNSATGGLRVDPSTLGAEVWVDGAFRGIGPVTLERLVEGEHIIRLVRRGHRNWGRKKSVHANSQEVIRQGLKPLPGFERLNGLGVQLADAAGSETYPRAAGELMDWMGVERAFFILVESGTEGLAVRAYYYDRLSQSRLKAQKKVFDPGDPSFDDMINLFCTTLYMDVSGQVIAGTGKSAGVGTEVTGYREEEKGESIGSSWWLWTAIGVVAAGGVGLALYLILGGEDDPGEGEVIFRF